MITVTGLFEAHLNVSDLERSMKFYGDFLGLEVASVFRERGVAFYWLGGRGKTMLGVWEVGTSPQRSSLHTAFTVELADLLKAPAALRAAGVEPLDFHGRPADQPVVLAWMPAVSLYFQDPDGNLLEFLAMLPEPPRPELGVVTWMEWSKRETEPRR